MDIYVTTATEALSSISLACSVFDGRRGVAERRISVHAGPSTQLSRSLLHFPTLFSDVRVSAVTWVGWSSRGRRHVGIVRRRLVICANTTLEGSSLERTQLTTTTQSQHGDLL